MRIKLCIMHKISLAKDIYRKDFSELMDQTGLKLFW